jgi:hypothetical protein
MMTWILLIFIHAGALSHSDDVSITTARFSQQNACETAGKEMARLAEPTVQAVKYACIHDAPSETPPK